MKFSLITLVFNRERHLMNLLKGVRKNKLQPAEIIIVNMGDMPDLSQYTDLPIIVVDFQKSVNGMLPLAAARNAGAEKAKHELLCFLDVDCVPSASYFEQIFEEQTKYKGIIMGTPRYLSKRLSEQFEEQDLLAGSIAHTHRPNVKQCAHYTDGGMFWSLCFTTEKSTFFNLGGFDEQFVGYGGEDTDFGFTLCRQGKGFHISGALVYHQQHPVYNPPVHKLKEIVQNSQLFYNKWGVWPMGAWLQDFTNYNLIDWNPDGKSISLKHYPDQKLLETCYKEDAPFM